MTLEQFINLLVVILGTIGSAYVLKSFLVQTPKVTRELASTMKWDINFEFLESLSEQKADGVTGTGLVVLTLVIAIINLTIVSPDFTISDNKAYAILLGLLIGVIIYYLLIKISKALCKRHLIAVVRIIANERLDEMFSKNKISYSETKTLLVLGERYLKLEIPQSKTAKEYIERFAKYLNRSVPENIQIEERQT